MIPTLLSLGVSPDRIWSTGGESCRSNNRRDWCHVQPNLSFDYFFTGFVATKTSESMAQAVEGVEGIEAARAFHRNIGAPAVGWASLGLRDVMEGTKRVGDEGVVFWGDGVIVDRRFSNTCCFEISQIIDDNNLLINGYKGTAVWLTMPTEGMMDGMEVDLSRKVFKYVGTKRYESSTGIIRTVIHLAYSGKYSGGYRGSPNTALAIESTVNAKHNKANAQLFSPRKWTDDTGKYNVNATFVDIKNGTVGLRRSDNRKMIRVPVERLSKPDRNMLLEMLQRQRNKKRGSSQQPAN